MTDPRPRNPPPEPRQAPEPGSPRIAALEPPHAPELAETLAKWMPPNSGREPLALFRVMARHPDLFARARPFGAGILGRGTVAPALREVMIHRTCGLTGAEYEWGVHAVAFGTPSGCPTNSSPPPCTGVPATPCGPNPSARCSGWPTSCTPPARCPTSCSRCWRPTSATSRSSSCA